MLQQKVNKQIEFMNKILENPYYPVPISDYPKLFDFVITNNGKVYLERLQREISKGNQLTEDEYLYTSLLSLADAVIKQSVKDCHNWQEFLYTIGNKVNLDKPGIKETLLQMGCIQDNTHYNPKLYKSHMIWKNNVLASIDNI